jgi:hypothetical protein
MTTRGVEYGPVRVAGLFNDFRRYKDSYELRFRKVVVRRESSYPHDLVDYRLLSLIVCGVCR